MARTYAKLLGSIWRDEDWRSLNTAQQRMYLLLLSQPEITNCGVIPYVPTRWTQMASDTTLDDVLGLIRQLTDMHYVVVDDDTCELLIRSFVKHDQIASQPKLVASAQRQFEQLQSSRIRTVLASEYPDLFSLRSEETSHPKPYGEGMPKGMPKPLDTPSRAGARPPLPLTTTATPAAAAVERLENAGWSAGQINAAVLELARAVAWLDHAEADPSCQSVGALSWSMFKKGGSPDVAATVANGAQGTRSTSKTVTYTCPECQAVFDTYLAREEHVDATHFEPAAPPTQRLSA